MADEQDPFRKVSRELEGMQLPADGLGESDLESKLQKLKQEAMEDEGLGDLEARLGEVNRRFEEEAEARQSEKDAQEAEFHGRISELDERLGTVRAAREAKEHERKRSAAMERDSARGLGTGLAVAYTIIGLPLAGAGIGWLMDKAMGTHTYVGIGVVAFGAIGMVVAIMILGKNSSR